MKNIMYAILWTQNVVGEDEITGYEMCISYFNFDQFDVLKSGSSDFAGQCGFCFAVLFCFLNSLRSSFILTCTAALRHTLQRTETRSH